MQRSIKLIGRRVADECRIISNETRGLPYTHPYETDSTQNARVTRTHRVHGIGNKSQSLAIGGALILP